uniref:Putative secreted protein n=1 Tax=Lutzomyia longipalpis TaxID=7200 RepID=A0A1B0ET99_LUTLO
MRVFVVFFILGMLAVVGRADEAEAESIGGEKAIELVKKLLDDVLKRMKDHVESGKLVTHELIETGRKFGHDVHKLFSDYRPEFEQVFQKLRESRHHENLER